jgi:ribosome-associated translation inhibitor RaiA
MEKPIQIRYHGVAASPAIDALVKEQAGHLERYFDRIIGCDVTIEVPERTNHKAHHFRVKVEVHVPGHTVVCDRDPDPKKAHTTCQMAVHDAFKHAKRQLEDLARIRSGRVKTHERNA